MLLRLAKDKELLTPCCMVEGLCDNQIHIGIRIDHLVYPTEIFSFRAVVELHPKNLSPFGVITSPTSLFNLLLFLIFITNIIEASKTVRQLIPM